jgi:MYXO-CTERM domain-containing protein
MRGDNRTAAVVHGGKRLLTVSIHGGKRLLVRRRHARNLGVAIACIVLLAVVLGCSSPASTQHNRDGSLVKFIMPLGFENEWDLSRWVLVRSATSNGTADESGAPDSVLITGSNIGRVSDGTSNVYTRLEIAAPSAVAISFSWQYSTDDTSPMFDPAYYYLGSAVTCTSDSTCTTSEVCIGSRVAGTEYSGVCGYRLSNDRGFSNQSGTVSIPGVGYGTIFGFGVTAVDNVWGAGHLTISDFSTSGAADGTACSEGTECSSEHCVDGVCCDTPCGNGDTSDCQACSTASGATTNGTCATLSSATVCRAADGDCDVAESCTGSSAICPADAVADSSVVCRSSDGDCDLAEYCDGTNKACPINVLANANTECRAKQGNCDVAENCTGISARCPDDLAVTCTAIDECHVAGTCAEQTGACTRPIKNDGTACTIGACSAGVCRLLTGQVCTDGLDCVTGHCVDNHCCDTACTDQCAACDVAGSEGICSAVTGAPHGERTACITDNSMVCGGSCDGVVVTKCAYPDNAKPCRAASCTEGRATLAANCSGSGECSAVQYQECSPYKCVGTLCGGGCTVDSDCTTGNYCSGGLCKAKMAQGQACGGDNQCVSANCIDGHCCNTACSGQCEACDLPDHLGTCSAIAGEPHGARPQCVSDQSVCGGACDGRNRGACAYPGATVSCRTASCADGMATFSAVCDGKGDCPPVATQICHPYVCGTLQCAGNCNADSDCISSAYCAAGVCITKLPNATQCAANNQCASALCADGYCCDRACTGQCEACDKSGALGTCGPVMGAPHGTRIACEGAGTCKGQCNGVKTDSCNLPCQEETPAHDAGTTEASTHDASTDVSAHDASTDTSTHDVGTDDLMHDAGTDVSTRDAGNDTSFADGSALARADAQVHGKATGYFGGGGCGCRVNGVSSAAATRPYQWLAGLLLLALAVRRKRRD